MIQLQEKQLIMIQQYKELLDTVEEAFEYIIEGFENLEKTEGDRLLTDVFAAFAQIASSNIQLQNWFENEKNMVKVIEAFEVVVEKVELLEHEFSLSQTKQSIIREHLYPAFSVWSIAIGEELKSYTQQ